MKPKASVDEATGGLSAADVAAHAALGIPAELLEAAGVCRVTHCQAEEYGCRLDSVPGADLSGIVYPYRDPVTRNRVSARLRRDNPERKPDGRPDNKYVCAWRDNRHLYFPPIPAALLTDTAIPILFVEAEKSSLAVMSWAQRRGLSVLAIATGGCNGWAGRTGKTAGANGEREDTRGPLPDFGLLSWTGREVGIAFDSNSATNPKVQTARGRLASHVTCLGARAKIATIPALPGVNGPDDLIGTAGDDAFAAALASAEDYRLDPVAVSVEELLHLSGVSLLAEGSDMATVEAALYRLGELMSGAPRLRRAAVRAASMARLKAAKVDGAAALVDAALSIAASSDDAQGQRIILRDPDPWPEPVDGAALVDEIVTVLRQYIILPDGSPEALALWALLTYLIDATDILPILGITSPDRRCGKSLVLDILASIVHRHIPAANISPAALFRAVEAYRPILLIDEADTFLDENEELRGILNSGHRRSSAFVVRCVGDDLEARQFSTWGPKALAKIGTLPTTLDDRAIVVRMKRKAQTETVERYAERRERDRLTELKRRCLRWAKDNESGIRLSDPADLPFLHDRANDNWRPLLAIADTVGGPWPELARESARLLSGTRDDDTQPARIQALIDIRDLFKRMAPTDKLSSAEIVKELGGMEDKPWPEWKREKAITQKQLASLLRPFGLKPKQFKEDGDKTRGYLLADFADAFSRYVPFPANESVPPVPSASSAGFQPKEQSVPGGNGTDSKNAEDPRPVGKVPMVPIRKGENGQVKEDDGVVRLSQAQLDELNSYFRNKVKSEEGSI